MQIDYNLFIYLFQDDQDIKERVKEIWTKITNNNI